MKGEAYFIFLIALIAISECKKEKEKKKCIKCEDLKGMLDQSSDQTINKLKEYIDEKFADLEKIITDTEPIYDCTDIKRQGNVYASGLFNVSQHNSPEPLQVFCDMETDDGGWTVIQRRQDGSVDFFRGWDDYVQGFGDPDGEFWIGLENINKITSGGDYEIRFDLYSFEGEHGTAKYSSFYIEGADTDYRLHVGKFLGGNAGDSFSYHNSMKFTTKAHDNDNSSGCNCAEKYTGAWWYNRCHHSNLNGAYYNNNNSGTSTAYAKHVVWYNWKGHYESMKKTEMKIRKV